MHLHMADERRLGCDWVQLAEHTRYPGLASILRAFGYGLPRQGLTARSRSTGISSESPSG